MEKALNRAKKSTPNTVTTTTIPTTNTSQPVVVPKESVTSPIALVHHQSTKKIHVEPLEDDSDINTYSNMSLPEAKADRIHRHHHRSHHHHRSKKEEVTGVVSPTPLSPTPVTHLDVIHEQPTPIVVVVVEDKMEIEEVTKREEVANEVNGHSTGGGEEKEQPTNHVSTSRMNPVSSFNKKLFLLGGDVRLKRTEDPRTIENTQLLWSKDHKCPIFYCLKAEPSSRSKDPESRPKPFIQKVYETIDDNLKNLELISVVDEYIAMLESHDDITEYEQKALDQLKTIRREGQQAYDTILKVYVKPKPPKKSSTTDAPETNDEPKPTKADKKRKEIATTINSSSSERDIVVVEEEQQDKKKKKLSKKKKSIDEDELTEALLSYEEAKLDQAKKLAQLRIVQQERKIKEIKSLSRDDMKKRIKHVIKREDDRSE